jgi:hypothetical protein
MGERRGIRNGHPRSGGESGMLLRRKRCSLWVYVGFGARIRLGFAVHIRKGL